MWLRRLRRSDGSGGLCRADRAAAYSPSQPLATLTRTSHQQALGRAGGVAAGFIGQRGRGWCGLPVLQGARRNPQQPTTKNQKPTPNSTPHSTPHSIPTLFRPHAARPRTPFTPFLAAAHTSSCALAGVQHVHTARRRPRRRHARLALPVARRGPGLRATAARAAGVRLTGAP